MRRLSLAMAGEYRHQCGECTACCELVGVSEIGKPYSCQCEHQTAGGCAVYDARPAECRDYFCLWLAGLLTGPERRPDRLGVMFEFYSNSQGATAVGVYEVRPGAFDQLGMDRLDWMVRRINTHLPESLSPVFIPYGVRIGTDYRPDEVKYPGYAVTYMDPGKVWRTPDGAELVLGV